MSVLPWNFDQLQNVMQEHLGEEPMERPEEKATDAKVVAPIEEALRIYRLDDPVAATEELAEQFYQETGFMAPYKDAPAAMGPAPYEERREAYDLWCKAWLSKFWDAVEALLERRLKEKPKPKEGTDGEGR